MARIIAGPRLDALRFGLLNRRAVCDRARHVAEALRKGYANQKAGGGSMPPVFWWSSRHGGRAPGFLQIQIFRGGVNAWGLALGNDSDAKPDVATFRPDMSRSGYLGAFQSPASGPGYLAIRDDAARSSVHPVQFDLSSAWLWNFATAEQAAQAAILYWIDQGVLTQHALNLAMATDGHKVTRVDVCVDHICRRHGAQYEWNEEDLNRFAGRAKTRGLAWLSPSQGNANKQEQASRHRQLYKGSKSFTLYVGSRSSTFLRIYDKIAEVGAERVGEYHATPVWLRNGWQPGEKIWRAEVQVCSDSLSYLQNADGLSMRRLSQLDPAALWAKYTETMRHVDPASASRLSRCKTSRRWQCLQAAAGDAAPADRCAIELKTSKRHRALKALRRAVIAAYREGVEQVDLIESVLKVEAPKRADDEI